MKILFLLDDDTVVVSSPEQLQLRQIQPNLAALVVPAGKNEEGEELLRPLVTYPVVLYAVPTPTVEATPAPTPQLVPAKKKSKKASAK